MAPSGSILTSILSRAAGVGLPRSG
jgi:hypothetical protein